MALSDFLDFQGGFDFFDPSAQIQNFLSAVETPEVVLALPTRLPPPPPVDRVATLLRAASAEDINPEAAERFLAGRAGPGRRFQSFRPTDLGGQAIPTVAQAPCPPGFGLLKNIDVRR